MDALDELALILGTARADLPPVFRFGKPKILKIGIAADLLARYPAADGTRLAAWFVAWTTTPSYLKLTASRYRRNRHDLDNEHAGVISPAHKWAAIQRLRVMTAAGEIPPLKSRAEAA